MNYKQLLFIIVLLLINQSGKNTTISFEFNNTIKNETHSRLQKS